jgi:hypothetical protein
MAVSFSADLSFYTHNLPQKSRLRILHIPYNLHALQERGSSQRLHIFLYTNLRTTLKVSQFLCHHPFLTKLNTEKKPTPQNSQTPFHPTTLSPPHSQRTSSSIQRSQRRLYSPTHNPCDEPPLSCPFYPRYLLRRGRGVWSSRRERGRLLCGPRHLKISSSIQKKKKIQNRRVSSSPDFWASLVFFVEIGTECCEGT